VSIDTSRIGPAGLPGAGPAGGSKVSPEWLALREPADAAARATDLVDLVRRRLAGQPHLLIHDLGSGTGAMARWLAPALPGMQHWVLHDRDPDLLGHAAANRLRDAGGAPVSVETHLGDLTRLTADDLDGASLVTASALLDMLTADELERVVAACHGAGCPALFTISVVGRVELDPADPLDQAVAEAFDAHQRRSVAGRTLLGPDAVEAAAEGFARRGDHVEVRPSPWRLGPDRPELTAEWLQGWLGAACEQRPELAGPAVRYASRRRGEIAARQLNVTVHHQDLLTGPE
jgi:Methyltransferase domain